LNTNLRRPIWAKNKEITMNTKIKIAAGMFAGLIAGTMLVGTAVAAPRMMTTPAFTGYGMMRSFDTSGTFGTSVLDEMNSFMDQYRTANGSVDVNRMHTDVVSGKVTPPHMQGMSRTGGASKFQGGRTSYRRGPAIMQGYAPSSSSTGYGMMGSNY
jgi:hypothetical protein